MAMGGMYQVVTRPRLMLGVLLLVVIVLGSLRSARLLP